MRETTLQPGRDRKVAAIYDEQLGYGRLYRQTVTRKVYPPSPRAKVLGDLGYTIERSLTPEKTALLKGLIFGPDGTCTFLQLPRPDMGAVLDTLLTPLDEVITSHFGTDYAVLFANGFATMPVSAATTEADIVSHKWHCDTAPRRHLKVIVYLDPATTHDGATAVLDRQTTDRFKEIGYVFSPSDERLTDLGEMAAAHGIAPLSPQRLVPDAGEALVFEPANVLHRGVPPTTGIRHVFVIGLVPFPGGRRLTFDPLYNVIRQNGHFEFLPVSCLIVE